MGLRKRKHKPKHHRNVDPGLWQYDSGNGPLAYLSGLRPMKPERVAQLERELAIRHSQIGSGGNLHEKYTAL